MRIDDYTPDAWHDVLADLPADRALEAVRRLAKTRTDYIGPADIRREVYRAAGLLAPDRDEMFEAMMHVAMNEGIGRSTMHPLAHEIYQIMGGAMSIPEMPRWAARRDFDAAWERIAAAGETERLAGDFGKLAARQLRALP